MSKRQDDSKLSASLNRMEYDEQPQETRSHFEGRAGRLSFILVSIGSAIGFGNMWRFPALAYEYGGGAFFIPYLLALFIIGIPMLTLEVSLGQFLQRGDPDVFAAVKERYRGIGLASITTAFFLMCYYSMLLCWTIRSFFDSFKYTNEDIEGVTGEQIYAYFLRVIVGEETLGPDSMPTRLVPQNVGYLFLTWLLVFLAVAFGVKVLGKISFFTMGLPLILLFVFLGKALTLPGASDGVHAYIGEWDMSILTEQPDVWSAAATQIFFSLSLVTGSMTAFGSHCERDAPAGANAVIISFCNSAFSIISGFAVFASLGFLSQQEGVPISELQVGGPGLLFGSYPAVFLEMPGGLAWVRLYYFDLFLLGLSSCNGLMEGILTPTQEMGPFEDTDHRKLAFVLSLFAFLCALLYSTDSGLYFLNTVDFYINYVFLVLGFFKCVAIGWITGMEKEVQSLGRNPVLLHLFTTFGSVIIASAICFGMGNSTGVYAGLIALFAIYIVGMAGVVYLCSKRKKEDTELTWKSIFYILFFRNTAEFQRDLQSVVGWIPRGWSQVIKHVVAPVLIVLFINLAAADNASGDPTFGNYDDLVTWPFQVLGIICFCIVCFIFLIGFIAPGVFSPLAPKKESIPEKDTRRKKSVVSFKMRKTSSQDDLEKEVSEADGKSVDKDNEPEQPIKKEDLDPEVGVEKSMTSSSKDVRSGGLYIPGRQDELVSPSTSIKSSKTGDAQ